MCSAAATPLCAPDKGRRWAHRAADARRRHRPQRRVRLPMRTIAQAADEAVYLGPAPSSQSYLNVPALVRAIEKTGADAVHPGYGFLSENAEFSEVCEEYNIKFIGASPEMIQKMGDKATAKDTMKKAGKAGELPFRLVAMMEDRYLMGEGKPQIYGTQGITYNNSAAFIWPIENPEDVNQRRKEAGFDTTIEVYAKDLFGEDFLFEHISLDEAEKRRLGSFNAN